MTNYQDTAVSPSGLVVPSATVTVFNAGLQSKPTIYSDQGTTPLTNPFQADAQGRFKFYAANGKYDVQVSGPGIVTQTKSDVEVFDSVGGGNWTGNVTGTLTGGVVGTLTTYNGKTLVANGVPTEIVLADVINQNGTAGATLFTPTANTLFRFSYVMTITLPGNAVTNTLQLVYTDVDANSGAIQNSPVLTMNGLVGTSVSGTLCAYVKAGGAVSYQTNLSGGLGGGIYSFHIRGEII